MEKFLAYLNNKGCKCENLQLFSAKFYRDSSTLKIIFSSPNEYTQSDIDKMQKCLEIYVENKCKVEVKVKKQIVSEDSCEVTIKKVLTQNALYSTIFDTENVKVKLVNSVANVTIKVDNSGFDDEQKEKFEQECQSSLKIFGITSTEFSYENFSTSFDQILSARKDAFDDEIVETPKTVSVSYVKQFLGKMESPVDAILPENVKGGLKNIFVAGTFNSLQEFTRKNKETGKESTYYKFSLNSEDFKIDCVCFLKNGKDLNNLEDGQKVVVLADSDEFRGGISLRIRALSICKFEFPKKVLKTASKTYKLIKPEPFVSKEQISFLEQSEKITNEYLLNNDFTVFDLETTGLNFNNCKIIEIGAVKIHNGKITETFSTFVNPECSIPKDATAKNNITDAMVKDAPTFEQVFPDFFKFIEGSTLVAHNINFDFPFISYYAKPLGYIIDNPTQDTLLIAQKHLGQLKHFRLQNVCDFFGISLIGAHRALNDTVATAKVFIKLIEKYGI